jgi:cyclopropane fatty-acyl-phospholipid synthase-like methyltransferase
MITTQSTTAQQKIIHYFEGAGLDYYYWDKAFNMHFGYFKPGMNPFNRPALLNQMNREVMNRLELHRYAEPTVLDLGCGLGAASRLMARENPEAQFHGFTITPWQVNFGNELSEEQGFVFGMAGKISCKLPGQSSGWALGSGNLLAPGNPTSGISRTG